MLLFILKVFLLRVLTGLWTRMIYYFDNEVLVPLIDDVVGVFLLLHCCSMIQIQHFAATAAVLLFTAAEVRSFISFTVIYLHMLCTKEVLLLLYSSCTTAML